MCGRGVAPFVRYITTQLRKSWPSNLLGIYAVLLGRLLSYVGHNTLAIYEFYCGTDELDYPLSVGVSPVYRRL